jgi:prepilin-type N-terminal cleavage/methylation domain-containing protein
MNGFKRIKQSLFKTGFTLIELMVVISVMALLMMMVLPSLTKAIELAKQDSCAVRLKNLYLGFGQFALENKDTLPVLTEGVGCFSQISSYMDNDDSEPESIQFARDYLGAHGEIINAANDIEMDDPDHVFRCPSSDPLYGTPTRPQMFASFEICGSSLYIDDATLPIRTFLLRQVKSKQVVSANYSMYPPGEVVLAMDRAYADGVDNYSSNHPDGANVLYGSGTISFIPTEDYARAMRSAGWQGEKLTRIQPAGTGFADPSMAEVLRPNKSFGWHGLGSSETSFFLPARNETDIDRWKSHGSADRACADGIFH